MKRLLTGLLLVAMVFSLFTGCTSQPAESSSEGPAAATEETAKTDESQSAETQAASSGEAQDGGVLKIALGASPKSLDPNKRTSAYETNVMKQIYDSLVVYSDDESEIVPAVATEWEVSEDGLEYTFKLRDDVYFHPGEYQDGRQMTAEDVKYSLERSTEATNVDLLELDHVEVLDEFSVKCVLKYPSAIFLDALTKGTQLLVCKEEVEGWGDDYTDHAIGSGPFKLKKFTLDQSIELERNDAYWAQKPHLDGVEFFVITESNQLVNGLKSGDLDVIQQVSGEGIKLVEDDPNLTLVKRPNTSVSFVGFNLESEMLQDKRIRQALIEAVDLNDVVKGVYPNDEAEFAGQPIPKASWGYTEELEQNVPTYDPEHAKELLKEAGYPDGFKITINLATSDVNNRLATALQSYWKNNLNVDLEIMMTQWAPYAEAVTGGNHDMYGVSISVSSDPYYYSGMLMSSQSIGTMRNGVRFNDPKLDEMIQDSLATTDMDERRQITQEIVAYAMDMYPAMYWCSMNIMWGMNNKVHGFTPKNEFKLVTEEVNVWMDN